MAEPVYDTHPFVKRLSEAGMPENQAEVLAAENMHIMTQVLATKDDVRALETTMVRQFAEVRAELAELRAEMRSGFAQSNAELAVFRGDTKGEIASLREELADFKTKLDSLENRLLIRLGALVVAVQAAALVIGKLF